MELRAASLIQRNPWIDAIIPIISILATVRFMPAQMKNLDNLYVGLSALAGIVMAAITFASSLIYGSDSKLMRFVRQNYIKNLASNILGMIIFSLTAAFLPLVSILLDASSLPVALAAASAVLILEETLRCIFWITFTFNMESSSQEYESDSYDTENAIADMRRGSSNSGDLS